LEDYGRTNILKGTYTTSGSSLTFTVIYFWGSTLRSSLSARWYSQSGMAAALGVNNSNLNDHFAPFTGTVNGNRLTVTDNWGE